MHCLFLVYWIKIPLYVSGINSRSSGGKLNYVANGTSKMTVSESGSLTVILEVQCIEYVIIHMIPDAQSTQHKQVQ
jgi:hypothetical protein